MKTALLSRTEAGTGETGLDYLWLNGERVLGIKGLFIYESCDKIGTISDISNQERDTLNRILQETLERHPEESVGDPWPQLVRTAKEYISGQGYCVQKKNKITIELRQSVSLVTTPDVLPLRANSPLTDAGLWFIHNQRRTRRTRNFISHF